MFDLGQTGRDVTYLNFRRVKASDPLQLITPCVATQEFNYSNFIDNSGDYLVAIERLKVPIQRIPMVPALNPAFEILAHANDANVETINTTAAYSLKEFVDQLSVGASTWKITPSGGVKIYYGNYAADDIKLSPTLQRILDTDVERILGAGAAADDSITFTSSIFDRFDQLDKIQVEARGLNVRREVVNTDSTLPILTDLVVPTSYSTSYTESGDANANDPSYSISYPTRQNILYGGDVERRFINLVGNLAVQNITLQAVAVFKDGTRNQISLPYNAAFECKLGFYQK